MSVVTGVETDARTDAKPPLLSGETCPLNTAWPAGSKRSALRETPPMTRSSMADQAATASGRSKRNSVSDMAGLWRR
jgi:hypothetical protein